MLYVFGHARLIGYDPDLNLAPDILASYDVQEGRIFTLPAAQGHRWSDGEPFTSEDFRFFWEDVATNATLQPSGPPIQLLVGGELPKVEILDELTVRYSWSRPNPLFVPALAAATAVEIYRPAHYLKQFHERYADPATLARLIKETKSRDWAQLFLRKDRLDDFDNPDMPTLQPWMQTTAPPGAALRCGAQPLLLPRRQQGAAAALSRPVHPAGGRPQADPDQDRRRRDRPAGPPPVLQGLHLPQAERAAQRAAHRCCGRRGAARIWRCSPTSTRSDPVWRGAVPRPALPPGAVARASIGRR